MRAGSSSGTGVVKSEVDQRGGGFGEMEIDGDVGSGSGDDLAEGIYFQFDE